MEEFDQYKVKVILKVKSSGHHDPLFPDRESSIEFDATDVHMNVILEQFRDFLTLIGYVIDPSDSLKLVKEDE
jgi:hypothetical protein